MRKTIYLGGGCFWGLEDLFRELPSVVDTRVGYSGGETDDPTYENHSGHAETLEVTYDGEKTSFINMLDFFFQVHDPTTLNRQGNDVGSSYRSVVFYSDDSEKQEAVKFIDTVNKSKRWSNPVVTTLEKFDKFYLAEEYHQNYLQKNPGGYTCHFRRFDSYI